MCGPAPSLEVETGESLCQVRTQRESSLYQPGGGRRQDLPCRPPTSHSELQLLRPPAWGIVLQHPEQADILTPSPAVTIRMGYWLRRMCVKMSHLIKIFSNQ